MTSAQALASVSLQQLVLIGFLIFCRVGACIALLPGLSGNNIPVQIRLFIALAFSGALLPIIAGRVEPALSASTAPKLVLLIFAETLVGLSIGMICRTFFWALQFMANAIAMVVGFSGAPGDGITEADPQPALATIITSTAVTLFFAADLHLDVVRALIASYNVVPVQPKIMVDAALTDVLDTLSAAFLNCLRIAAPFIVFSVMINFSIGLINKLTPAIPIYFISLPFVLGGSLVLLYFLLPEMLRIFLGEAGSFLKSLY